MSIFGTKSDSDRSASTLDRDRGDAIIREMDKLVDRMRQVTEKLEKKFQPDT